MDKIKIDELNTETDLTSDHLIIVQDGKDQETKNTSLNYLKLWLKSISFEDLTKILVAGESVKIDTDVNGKTISISSSAVPTKWYVGTAPSSAEKGDLLLLENGNVSEYDGKYWQITSINLRGAEGVSPQVKITEIDNGYHLSITDKSGEQSMEVLSPYINESGYWVVQNQVTEIKAQGKDGVSPSAEVSQEGNTITILINKGTELESSATIKAPTIATATASKGDYNVDPKVTIETDPNTNESTFNFIIPQGRDGSLGVGYTQYVLKNKLEDGTTAWSNLEQTVRLSKLNSSSRNVIDIPYNQIRTWASLGVVPKEINEGEDYTEIVFGCDIEPPLTLEDLIFYIASMGVVTEEG